jgi:hypothetical protein
MKDKIDQIRNILDQLEKSSIDSDDQTFMQNFDALEIPDIITTIVDYLQPDLSTYEAAIYWFLFRHSVLENGQQYLRASVRGLMKGVVTSSSGQSKDMSYAAVQKSLQALEEKGAILKAGDTNREGTLYKVLLPEEITLCQERMKNAKVGKIEPIDTKKELDYYNVRENRLKVFERDGYKCHYCEKQLTRFTATLDHIQPVSKGGDNSFENLVTSCLLCNSRRGNRPVMDIINEQENS